MSTTYEKYLQLCKSGTPKSIEELLKKDSTLSYEIGFRQACEHDNMPVVKFHLTSPITKDVALERLDEGLDIAAWRGYLPLVKYLLTDPSLPKHANIHAYEDSALRLSSYQGFLEMVEFLTSSAELKEHADIHARQDESYKNAYMRHHQSIVKYFEKNLKMSLSDDIKHLWMHPDKEVLESKGLRM